MVSRGKKSYLHLIHQLLHLLCQEAKLKTEIANENSNLDGLLYHRARGYNMSIELKRIQSTIERINKTHADLVALLRERLSLKDCSQMKPVGNAGHYRLLVLKEALELNKDRIGEIINPSDG